MAKEVSGFPVLAEKDDGSVLEEALRNFNSENHDAFTFRKDDQSKRQQFISRLLEIVQDQTTEENSMALLKESLSALVVMSRDVLSMRAKFVTKQTWNNLTLFAGLKGKYVGEMPHGSDIAISSCKCLSNIIFLTKDSNGFCDDDEMIGAIGVRLNALDPKSDNDQTIRQSDNDCELEFLMLRLLFLISVFSIRARTKIVENHNGRRLLIDLLTEKMKNCQICDHKTPCERAVISSLLARSCSEILKTLFNLNIKAHNDETRVREEKIVGEFEDLTGLCRKCLLTKVQNDSHATEKLHGDAQNCLYSVPSSCLNESLLIPVLDELPADDKFLYQGPDIPSFEKRDLSAVLCILKSVEEKIKTSKISTENLQPVLSLLSHLSRNSRSIRKYCKNYVIPPRHDFVHRPEVGPKFQNKLIKLFTNANTEVKGAAEDFVFVLCKEKVDRLVKYAGYGNSAGLLVNRGLLAGGQGDTIYSDTDSDSDTEEYRENAEKINPITGHIPPDIPNPMEGMSDEQKEFLAVQLANQLSKLSDDDVIKPVCIDPNTGNLVSFQQRVHETVLPEEKGSDDDGD